MAAILASKPGGRCSYSEPMLVRDPRIIDAICRFRARAWTVDDGLAAGAFPDGQWRDRFDDRALHWIICDDSGRLVAAARLTLHDGLEDMDEWRDYERYGLSPRGKIAAPARIVVCSSARGQGLAARLLDAQDDAAREALATCALRQASQGMAKLLPSRGWNILGPASPDPRFPGVRFQVAQLVLRPTDFLF